MADDPYLVLGVGRNASEDEIRRAYRKLAKELHPDVRPDDPVAMERFKRVASAYDIIGDPARRIAFDAGEIDAAGEPVRGFARQGAGAGWRPREPGEADSIFADLFASRGAWTGGASARLRGQDARYSLEVEFLEAVQGARRRVTMPDGGILDLTVPEGVADGQILRLKGKGGPGVRGGEPGDALVEIRVKPHPKFKRIGNDLAFECPITIDEAVLGARIEVVTASGRVALQIPKATSSGKVLRLKGKGVRSAADGTTGDLLVTIRIVLPDTIDDTLSYFMTEWRQNHHYDPGRD